MFLKSCLLFFFQVFFHPAFVFNIFLHVGMFKLSVKITQYYFKKGNNTIYVLFFYLSWRYQKKDRLCFIIFIFFLFCAMHNLPWVMIFFVQFIFWTIWKPVLPFRLLFLWINIRQISSAWSKLKIFKN